jgi:sterol desaturase/sphingolipid hydroxylase (fatty acid hydroxylase superfamily)
MVRMIDFILVQLIYLGAFAVVLGLAEWLLQTHPSKKQPPRRLITDFCHIFIGGYLAVLLIAALQEALSPAPMFNGEALPLWMQFAIILLVGDLWIYVMHRTAHAVPLLWRIHRIHHSSIEIDWLAAFRNHPIELLWFNVPRSAAIVLCGFSPWVGSLYFVIYAVHSTFVHANASVRIPIIEKWIGLPNFHHGHHAIDVVDRNFGAQLLIWDRMFGTAIWRDEQASEFGLDDPPRLSFLSHMVAPFQRLKFSLISRSL